MRTRSTKNIRNNSTIHPVISVEQAIADGLSPSFLRTVANSLERIAKYGFYQAGQGNMSSLEKAAEKDGHTTFRSVRSEEMMTQARILRGVARMVEKNRRRS